ncbi:hypothetical protein LO80_03565 [Candidatus Francisella endociliophora]|uniref:Thioredoxin-like fold domain-containing protein n=1 Tax=Candidatus Francisella endociliophora TaxID=653937 RepID=A0A097ENJ5_9GAMM|nr:thioredoxin domain-containing protein [Francisella sp. FSC1006]AIT09135.1 hypothetical protein LO80_03565 [Francisella sp. FSC1006]
MKKILITMLGVSALALSSCSNQPVNQQVTPNSQQQAGTTNQYVQTIANENVIKELLMDENTPQVGPKDAKEAVVIFFDFGCGTCAQISRQVSKLMDDHPDVKFIFKAYPSPKRDAKVPNYATLIASEAYIQGGSELFMAYDKAIFDQRIANGKLTQEDVDAVAEKVGIKYDKKELEQKAASEELQSRKLGKMIGFRGPHDIIIMPTKLADMSQSELDQNAESINKDVFVISHMDAQNQGLDSEGMAKWEAEQISNKLS